MSGPRDHYPSPTDSSARFIKPKSGITWHDGLTDEEDRSPKHSLGEGQEMIRKRQRLEPFAFSGWNKTLQEEFHIPSRALDHDPGSRLAYEISEMLGAVCTRDGGPSMNQLPVNSIYSWLVEHTDMQLQLRKHLQNGEFDLAVGLLDESHPDSHNRHNPVSVDPEIWDILFRNWTGEYYGESLNALKGKLRDYESITQKSDTYYYSKSIAVIQGSGTGKSRLASELGKSIFSLVFTLRGEGSTGYPPGDTEVYRFLTQGDNPFHVHSRMFALLSSALQFGKLSS